jgi:hypothetical protein
MSTENSNDDDELLVDGEAARELGIKPKTLPTWRCNGYGPSFLKVGRKVFYRRGDIRAWLLNQRREPVRAGAR